jgi:hypothetical protein
MAEERRHFTVSASDAERRNRSFMQIQERMSGKRRGSRQPPPIGLPRATSRASQSRMGRQTGPAGAAQRMASQPAYVSNPRDVSGAGRLLSPRDRLTVGPRDAAAAQPPPARPFIAPIASLGAVPPQPLQRASAHNSPFPGHARLTTGAHRHPGLPPASSIIGTRLASLEAPVRAGGVRALAGPTVGFPTAGLVGLLPRMATTRATAIGLGRTVAVPSRGHAGVELPNVVPTTRFPTGFATRTGFRAGTGLPGASRATPAVPFAWAQRSLAVPSRPMIMPVVGQLLNRGQLPRGTAPGMPVPLRDPRPESTGDNARAVPPTRSHIRTAGTQRLTLPAPADSLPRSGPDLFAGTQSPSRPGEVRRHPAPLGATAAPLGATAAPLGATAIWRSLAPSFVRPPAVVVPATHLSNYPSRPPRPAPLTASGSSVAMATAMLPAARSRASGSARAALNAPALPVPPRASVAAPIISRAATPIFAGSIAANIARGTSPNIGRAPAPGTAGAPLRAIPGPEAPSVPRAVTPTFGAIATPAFQGLPGTAPPGASAPALRTASQPVLPNAARLAFPGAATPAFPRATTPAFPGAATPARSLSPTAQRTSAHSAVLPAEAPVTRLGTLRPKASHPAYQTMARLGQPRHETIAAGSGTLGQGGGRPGVRQSPHYASTTFASPAPGTFARVVGHPSVNPRGPVSMPRQQTNVLTSSRLTGSALAGTLVPPSPPAGPLLIAALAPSALVLAPAARTSRAPSGLARYALASPASVGTLPTSSALARSASALSWPAGRVPTLRTAGPANGYSRAEVAPPARTVRLPVMQTLDPRTSYTPAAAASTPLFRSYRQAFPRPSTGSALGRPAHNSATFAPRSALAPAPQPSSTSPVLRRPAFIGPPSSTKLRPSRAPGATLGAGRRHTADAGVAALFALPGPPTAPAGDRASRPGLDAGGQERPIHQPAAHATMPTSARRLAIAHRPVQPPAYFPGRRGGGIPADPGLQPMGPRIGGDKTLRLSTGTRGLARSSGAITAVTPGVAGSGGTGGPTKASGPVRASRPAWPGSPGGSSPRSVNSGGPGPGHIPGIDAVAGVGLAAIPLMRWAWRRATAGAAGGTATTGPAGALVSRRPALVGTVPTMSRQPPGPAITAVTTAVTGTALARSISPGPSRLHQAGSLLVLSPQRVLGLQPPNGLHLPVGPPPNVTVVQGLAGQRTASRQADVDLRGAPNPSDGTSQRPTTGDDRTIRRALGPASLTTASPAPGDMDGMYTKNVTNRPPHELAGPRRAPNTLRRATDSPARPPGPVTRAPSVGPITPRPTLVGDGAAYGTAGLPVLPIAGAAFALGRRQASAQAPASSGPGVASYAAAGNAGGATTPLLTIDPRTGAVRRSVASSSAFSPAPHNHPASRPSSASSPTALTGFAMTAEGAKNQMLDTSGRTEVRRAPPVRPSALSLPAGDRTSGAEVPVAGYPGATGAASGPASQALTEQSRGPQLSEQLDMLADVLAARRLADLERRGLFLRPEVF